MESISLSVPAKKANFLIDPDIAGDQQHDDYDDDRNKPHNLPRVVYRFLMTWRGIAIEKIIDASLPSASSLMICRLPIDGPQNYSIAEG